MKAFDPLAALRTLLAYKVDFVLIGGLAARLQGSPTVTDDLDVCHDRTPANLKRLTKALSAMDATLRLPDPDEKVAIPLDERLLAVTDNLTLNTDFGAFDLLARPAGTDGYDDLIRGALSIKLERALSIKVANIEDLIRMKRAAGRPKDLIEVEILTAVQDES